MSEFICGDCMDYLPNYPDGYFDLAITDPPYGEAETDGWNRFNGSNFRHYFDNPEGDAIRHSRGRGKKYLQTLEENGGSSSDGIEHWDYAPEPAYFDELRRVSKNQIIWGGNYFDLPPTRCFVVWRKVNIPADGFSMAPVEYAWTSFNRNAEFYEKGSAGTKSNPRIHPTQKPVELYIWLLNKFAEPGMKVLDTHVGSGSSLIACERMGLEYVGFEVNETYHRLASERIDEETRQMTLVTFG